jgi:hypothetical protein
MKKFAIGCGIAALVLAALIVGAGVITVSWVKNQMGDAERLTRISREMEQTYGAPEEFVPPADGRYDSARIDRFVQVRAELLDAGEDLRDRVNQTAEAGDQGWWRELRSMLKLLNAGAGYLATADSLLLAAEMAHGEYAHYQTLMLHGQFGESPEEFLENNPQMATESEFNNAFAAMVDEYSLEARRLLQAHARNALEAADSLGTDCESCPEWIEYLDEQLGASRNRRSYIPMTEPLPETLDAALQDRSISLETLRPRDAGAWMLELLMVMELEDDGQGVKIEFGN